MRKLKTILVAALAATMVISSMTMAAMASDSKDISVTVKDLSQDWGKATGFTNMGYIGKADDVDLSMTIKSVEINGIVFEWKEANNDINMNADTNIADDNALPNVYDKHTYTVIAESADGDVIEFDKESSSYKVKSSTGASIEFSEATYNFAVTAITPGTYTLTVDSNVWKSGVTEFKLSADTKEETTTAAGETTTAGEETTTTDETKKNDDVDKKLGDAAPLALVLSGVATLIIAGTVVCTKRKSAESK